MTDTPVTPATAAGRALLAQVADWDYFGVAETDNLATWIDRIEAEAAAPYREALDYAKQIIESYQLDIRNLPEYLRDNPTDEGFCQGVIYREALADIDRRAARSLLDE